MIDWRQIQHVFVDMDGTLLDLYFDNYFWAQHVPVRFAEKYDISIEDARQDVLAQYKSVEGTLQWYSVDYWSERLGLNILQLKQEVSHLINPLPNAIKFLRAVRNSGKRVVLLTNAHSGSVNLKMQMTKLVDHLDRVISSHELGLPKEHPDFWHTLRSQEDFNPETSLLIDDNIDILRIAAKFGIRYLLAVSQPDSRAGRLDSQEFMAIDNLADIMPR